MAQYQIKHSCGHIESHQIYGTNVNGEREKKAEWLSSQLCRPCFEAKRAEENAKKAEANADAGLPALSGSEKQISWAESIRAKAIADLTPIRAQISQNAANNPKVAEIALTIIDRVISETKASWWIDNRSIAFGQSWIAAEVKKQL